MLPEALEALAAAGGVAVVEAMATDAWTSVRPRLLRLLGGGPDDVALIETASADDPAVWQDRLRRLLTENPAAADDLRALLGEIRGAAVQQQHNTATGQGTVNAVLGGNLTQIIGR